MIGLLHVLALCKSGYLRLKVRQKRAGSISYFTPNPAKNTVFKVKFSWVQSLACSLPERGAVASPFWVPALFRAVIDTGHVEWTKPSFMNSWAFVLLGKGSQSANEYISQMVVSAMRKRRQGKEWDRVWQGGWRGQRPCLWWSGIRWK